MCLRLPVPRRSRLDRTAAYPKSVAAVDPLPQLCLPGSCPWRRLLPLLRNSVAKQSRNRGNRRQTHKAGQLHLPSEPCAATHMQRPGRAALSHACLAHRRPAMSSQRVAGSATTVACHHHVARVPICCSNCHPRSTGASRKLRNQLVRYRRSTTPSRPRLQHTFLPPHPPLPRKAVVCSAPPLPSMAVKTVVPVALARSTASTSRPWFQATQHFSSATSSEPRSPRRRPTSPFPIEPSHTAMPCWAHHNQADSSLQRPAGVIPEYLAPIPVRAED
mmetsp:Transcript_85727/g.247617  ORF Transcript_85727/g.247617 Transcript_85727/m.247617 type:complete len:275 (-) Transcript_85727:114-938(-)